MTPSNPDKATLPFILALLGTHEQALQEQEIAPQTLVDIYNDYVPRHAELTAIAELVSHTLMQTVETHAVRYRVKDPLHLLRKIIRKRKEYPERVIDASNYLHWINDLVGVRVLHLYRDAWVGLGNYIQGVWELKKAPQAYVRAGDSSLDLQRYAELGCKVVPRASGYRAVHFVVETKPNKQPYFVEIQLKTLFEEGWSEIDHTIRYPDHVQHALLNNLLQLLNDLTASADDMASHIRELTYTLEKQALGHKAARQQQEKALAQLQAQLADLPMAEEVRQRLYTQITELLQRGEI